MPPPLVYYETEAEYRQHYEVNYCQAVIRTFDGMRVYFPKRQFDDAFFESANRKARDKSVFARKRAERIGWLREVLEDSGAALRTGWDRDKKRPNPRRRLAVAYGNYVVVVHVKKNRQSATFITAYVASASTVQKILGGPAWQ